MKKLFLLFITISIFSCSSDESNNDDVTTVVCENAVNIFPNFIDENSISISWANEVTNQTQPESWSLEIGPQGFTPGSGTTFSVFFNDFTFQNLMPQTSYDIYIKSKCGDSFGSNVGPTTLTTESACSTPQNLGIGGVSSCSFVIDWFGNNENAWEIEYGETGFALGTGTVANTSSTNFTIEENISPNTTYEVYVRANCGSQGFSNYTEALVVSTEQAIIESSFFTGNYLIEYITDGTFTSQGFGEIFGTGTVVNVQTGTNNLREFNVQYYPDGIANTVTFPFRIQLMNNETILVQTNNTVAGSCDGMDTIELGPSNETQTFDSCDDTTLEFTFFELYQGSGNCGSSDFPVTIRLTEQ